MTENMGESMEAFELRKQAVKAKKHKIVMAIKEDFGSIKHWCRKQEPAINLHTFHVVFNGYGKSTKIYDLLIAQGYINHASDLDRAVAHQSSTKKQ